MILVFNFLLKLLLGLSVDILPLLVLLFNIVFNWLTFLSGSIDWVLQISDTTFIVAALMERLHSWCNVDLSLKSGGFVLKVAQFFLGFGKLFNILGCESVLLTNLNFQLFDLRSQSVGFLLFIFLKLSERLAHFGDLRFEVLILIAKLLLLLLEISCLGFLLLQGIICVLNISLNCFEKILDVCTSSLIHSTNKLVFGIFNLFDLVFDWTGFNLRPLEVLRLSFFSLGE